MTGSWPVRLASGPVGLRPIRLRDAGAWREIRQRNLDWLTRWEATSPEGPHDIAPTYAAMVRKLRQEARQGRSMPFVVTYEHRLVGQLTVNGITWGSFRSGFVGYWIDRAYAGRGVIPTALALVVDHCFAMGLHRIEVNIRPENAASRRVVEKLGFRQEGIRARMLHIDGAWRDHLSYALTAEEVQPDGLLTRWRASRARPTY
jgi:[ribosomal protein S5]-alanine N-acetyltransferase